MLAVAAVSPESKATACTGQAIRLFILRITAVLVALYFFLVGLDLMGRALVVLGGKGAATLFASAGNPVNGFVIGIMTTALVQSLVDKHLRHCRPCWGRPDMCTCGHSSGHGCECRNINNQHNRVHCARC